MSKVVFFKKVDGCYVAPLATGNGELAASFFAAGDPIPAPRPRLGVRGVYHDQKADPWKSAVIAAFVLYQRKAQVSIYLTNPVELNLQFLFKKPKSNPEKYWADRKPDLDNLEKAVMDALTDGRAWHDDSQVVLIQSLKRYVMPDEEPGVHIEIVRLPQTAALGNLPPAGNRGARSLSGKETL